MDKDGNYHGDIEIIPDRFFHKHIFDNCYPPSINIIYQENNKRVVVPEKDVYVFQVRAENEAEAARIANINRTKLIIYKKWLPDYQTWAAMREKETYD